MLMINAFAYVDRFVTVLVWRDAEILFEHVDKVLGRGIANLFGNVIDLCIRARFEQKRCPFHA